MKIAKANAKTSMKSLQEPCWGRKRNQYKNMPQEDQQKLKEYRRSYELAKNNFFVMHSIRGE